LGRGTTTNAEPCTHQCAGGCFRSRKPARAP
jgi:hypothetical protein